MRRVHRKSTARRTRKHYRKQQGIWDYLKRWLEYTHEFILKIA